MLLHGSAVKWYDYRFRFRLRCTFSKNNIKITGGDVEEKKERRKGTKAARLMFVDTESDQNYR